MATKKKVGWLERLDGFSEIQPTYHTDFEWKKNQTFFIAKEQNKLSTTKKRKHFQHLPLVSKGVLVFKMTI